MKPDFMFRGLVEETGTVKSLIRDNDSPANYILEIEAGPAIISSLKKDDNVAVNGVCLSVADLTPSTFIVHIWPQTQTRTNLLSLQKGGQVNLERNRAGQKSEPGQECNIGNN